MNESVTLRQANVWLLQYLVSCFGLVLSVFGWAGIWPGGLGCIISVLKVFALFDLVACGMSLPFFALGL